MEFNVRSALLPRGTGSVPFAVKARHCAIRLHCSCASEELGALSALSAALLSKPFGKIDLKKGLIRNVAGICQ